MTTCTYNIICISPELSQVIENSFSPKPKVIVLDSVTDIKNWMSEQTPPMHDHLKAHQFKFKRTKLGTRMWYKEWSTDKFWLPETGLAILPSDNPTPKWQPTLIMPHHDMDNILKLDATIKKVNLTWLEYNNIICYNEDWCIS